MEDTETDLEINGGWGVGAWLLWGFEPTAARLDITNCHCKKCLHNSGEMLCDKTDTYL